jgi:hypothetical protein
MRRPIICQIVRGLPLQCCGKPADQIYKCEEIGPHERCKVGEHTIVHERRGNGYSCESVQDRIDKVGYIKAFDFETTYTVIGQ